MDLAFDSDAISPEWEEFLKTIFNDDAELISYVQRLLGYCCTGVVAEHVLPVLHGVGANGKSTLIGVLQRLLGDHAITAPEGLVIRHSHEPHPERIAVLRGKRLVVSHELDASAVLAEQVVKMLTGGDALSGRELYGHRFNFNPTHKVLLVTNHKPRIRGNDHAIWRRVCLVPFETLIPTDKQEPNLGNRLVDEHGPAILTWLVQGAMDWRQHGLGIAPAVESATTAYREAQDMLGIFLLEETESIERARVKFQILYDEWKRWCDLLGERPGRNSELAAEIMERGYQLESYQGAKFVIGLRIKTPELPASLESE